MLHEIPELLAKQGILDDAALARLPDLEALEPDIRIDQLLLKHGLVSEEALLAALGATMGFEFVPLESTEPEPDALKRAPAKFVFKHRVFPIRLREDTLYVATSQPFDILSLDELETLTGLTVEPVFATAKEIAKRIKQYYGVAGETIGDLVQQFEGIEVVGDDGGDSDEDMAETASVIRLVNEILTEGVRERASDIHIEPGEDSLSIRYRIDGVLQSQSLPSEIHHFKSAIASRIKIMSKLNIAEKRKPQDGRIRLRVDEREIDLRVSIIPMLHGEGIVMRILDKGAMVYDLQKIGMDPGTYGRFRKLIQLPHGIILVTGPTGSGKSTTLYASLGEIKDEATKIITVEDPVEYVMNGISQIQVNHKVGLDFPAGLRAILRHDPDVVLIGEIRDFETAQIATQAAMTGHLVFSTLHTNDAAGSFSRLIDMGVEPYLVSSTVMGVMAQRLVRRICRACARPEVVDPAELPDDFPTGPRELMRGAGCEKCRKTGYAGRIGIYELLISNGNIQRMILTRDSSTAIKEEAVREGMTSLRQSGWARVLAGMTTVAEVMRVTKDDELPTAKPTTPTHSTSAPASALDPAGAAGTSPAATTANGAGQGNGHVTVDSADPSPGLPAQTKE